MTTSKDVPKDNKLYGTKDYWEQRYQQEATTTYDWLKTYKDLKPFFETCLGDRSASMLMLGCGNSSISEDMYDDGYHSITNVDFSGSVIENMAKRCVDRTDMKWMEMDVRKLEFQDNTFDIVLDKATLDTFFVDCGDVWNPKESVLADVKAEVDEALRVLKVGGKFVIISFGQPHFRKQYIKREQWEDIKVSTIGDFFGYFIYEMTKIA
ncbi:hypothetical protein SAMD00019534_081350 [Acytostelium subglobosum LB1]|uniref:hypothetical protein n=1 Tax=Acytostelium subglobosum LB1 TaxID=1410327 RepID=UPI0006450977|nr:hypothetical protein SAMD00019534_081350 [Acytostelium subglobosum LB1]GAM24960.1 hypothetical protein SAMD00019534_081350 [Acytostelium subglobosum LB1]|eukprot:XP_012752049.1 hypothetical protein SAMD00019534_081350 [Acytostelium subglobosum LB1]